MLCLRFFFFFDNFVAHILLENRVDTTDDPVQDQTRRHVSRENKNHNGHHHGHGAHHLFRLLRRRGLVALLHDVRGQPGEKGCNNGKDQLRRVRVVEILNKKKFFCMDA